MSDGKGTIRRTAEGWVWGVQVKTGACARAPKPPTHLRRTWKTTPTQAALGSLALTATTLCCSSLQSLGRMGRMVGGSRMPSSMWMTPLAASTSTLRRGTPSGPSRMRPCGGAQHASLAQSPPLHSAHRQKPSLPATSSPAPWQHLLLWQNHSSLCTLTHMVSVTWSPSPCPCAHPPPLWSPPSLLGPRRGI